MLQEKLWASQEQLENQFTSSSPQISRSDVFSHWTADEKEDKSLSRAVPEMLFACYLDINQLWKQKIVSGTFEFCNLSDM